MPMLLPALTTSKTADYDVDQGLNAVRTHGHEHQNGSTIIIRRIRRMIIIIRFWLLGGVT